MLRQAACSVLALLLLFLKTPIKLPCDKRTDILQADARSLDGVHVTYVHTLGLSAAGGASASAAAAAPSKYRSAFFFLGLASAAKQIHVPTRTSASNRCTKPDAPDQELRSAKIHAQSSDANWTYDSDACQLNLIIHLNAI